MIFSETDLRGAFVIDLERLEDERGSFARAWCRREFEEHGLDTCVAQCNVAFNKRRGTLRGLHYQRTPQAEAKLVRCTKGAVYDVIVDLRPDSPTYMGWLGVELTEESGRMLYVPEGLAHGYQTLVDATETFYQMSQFYAPEMQAGVRWDDPAFGIEWPEVPERVISEKDQSWPDYVASRSA